MTATVLDERLEALRDAAREWGTEFRTAGAGLDTDPDGVGELLDLGGVRCLATMLVPEEFGGAGLRLGPHRFHGMTAIERTVVLEELARGDAGLMLASPGASMSGVLVDVLADREQKEWFYGRLLKRPTWTFFALTEPDRGSDATALETALTTSPDGGPHRLDGRKKYVGNAARAALGVVFARTGPGPLGVTAVLVDTTDPGFHAEPLESLGLRAARICELTLDGVAVPAERVLGRDRSPARRGMWACVQTFNRLRPGVAAIALGIAAAAHDYVRAEGGRLDELGRRIDGVRHLVHLSAIEVDADGSRGHLASAAKAEACRLAEDATLEACGFFGPRARWDHPALDKLARDARGVEFMEGAGNIQKLTVFQGLLAGKVGRGEPFPAHAGKSSTGGSSCG
ncbi:MULTISPECIES: acyl-CoA dehydrogenase family protein [unclassified Amycolatopsis]|uniref:acyl-CoA dehydrogenase family protein n=1 Tax=unclassified Amycolatopsis TaxID=2618356 RepID=UPI0028741EFE|nr:MULTISPECIES: acyl-CoA dehydrogenase family protein [unclassified Amycolatopsis]MDS0134337.1 acyl-CoA/acyl-ACP dehydrogenase [Amycolatopsis sp. 505]MDS0148921.1 acyl-CoA/acyl-ACP dehydrogenase [Amycolatopsis sp. CM201R]